MIIYKTTNLINGKFYIGKDCKNNPNYIGSGNNLLKAVKKYGIENFNKEILEYCTSNEELSEREKYWIEITNARGIGYNIAEGGSGGKTIPVVWNKGKTYEELMGEKKAKKVKEKLSNSHKGLKQSEETKQKKNKKLTGQKRTKETGIKISNSLKGKKISESTKNKISMTLKEYYKNNPEAGQKISNKNKGRKLNDSQKKKISEGIKRRGHTKPIIHQCCRIWYFYNKENELIFQHIGNYNKFCTKNKISRRKTKKFNDLQQCMSLKNVYEYKVFWEKYWK